MSHLVEIKLDETLTQALDDIGVEGVEQWQNYCEKVIRQAIAKDRSANENEYFDHVLLSELEKVFDLDTTTYQIMDFGEFMDINNKPGKIMNLYRSDTSGLVICSQEEIKTDIKNYSYVSSETDSKYAWLRDYHYKVKVYNGIYKGKIVKFALTFLR